MDLRDFRKLAPDALAERLRDLQMTPERFEELCASFDEFDKMAAAMEAAGTMPKTLPEGKLGDSASYGLPSPSK